MLVYTTDLYLHMVLIHQVPTVFENYVTDCRVSLNI